jgi:hypothetical protein
VAGTWDFAVTEGTIAVDALAPQVELTITTTSTATFPTGGGAVIINEGGGSQETLDYDSFLDPDISLADPTSHDHFIGEPVRLTSEPIDASGAWDVATWTGEQSPSGAVQGASGMGRDFAVAVRGLAYSRTTFVAVDVYYTIGGFL